MTPHNDLKVIIEDGLPGMEGRLPRVKTKKIPPSRAIGWKHKPGVCHIMSINQVKQRILYDESISFRIATTFWRDFMEDMRLELIRKQDQEIRISFIHRDNRINS
jgi:hypothetical protein